MSSNEAAPVLSKVFVVTWIDYDGIGYGGSGQGVVRQYAHRTRESAERNQWHGYGQQKCPISESWGVVVGDKITLLGETVSLG